MKKQLLLFAMMLLPLVASAQAEIDGIYYYLSSDNTASVTSNPNQYSGSVVIPEKVTYESIEYSVTSIGGSAFFYCSGLTSVTIGNSVTSIGYAAFEGCTGLTSITIPNSVTSIGLEAFSGCSGLTSVTIPNSVTSISDGAFYHCSGLTSITIPNSVTSIGSSAFRSCYGLTSVTIGNSVTSIGSYAFDNCSSLKKVIVKDIAAWCGIEFYGSNSNPLFYAKHIYSDEDTEITNLIIPNSVTSIGNSAFSYCSGLTSITIPNSVTSIGNGAFSGCSGLTSITIPNSVTSIGDGAFTYCSGLTSVSVENGNTVYDSRDNCNAIIETATNTLLYGCNITIIPNNVTSIGNTAFYNCSGLTSITIPNSVTSIGYEAFYKCSGLTSITIPNSVTSIGSYAFFNCSGLTSVTIGNSVTSIGGSAFENCSGLTSVTIPNNVTDLSSSGGIFKKCTGLKTVIIGSGITRIPQRTFLDCSSLESITCLNPTPPSCYNQRSEYWPFKDFTAILYVPKGSILQYKAADVWRNFVIIREIADEDNDIYLTINDGAKGSVKLKVIDANPFFTLKLEPDNGWQVSSLTLNGENVKAEMTEDGTYTTPAINSNSTLYVVYSQGATSAAALHTDDYQLSAFGNTLTISGTEGGEQISVYSIEGKNVTSLTAKKGTTEIVVNNNQTYIVKVKDQVYKIRM